VESLTLQTAPTELDPGVLVVGSGHDLHGLKVLSYAKSVVGNHTFSKAVELY
jgi:hypothetical protein